MGHPNEVLAIIPARGGSKGIPRKNLVPLHGKPLIAYSIETALRANRVSRVVVTTDDSEIADVSRRFGADVVMRPPAISGDLSSSEEALIHAVDDLESRDGYRPDLIAFLQCTSPLTHEVDIDGTIFALLDQDADSAFTVAPFHFFLWRHGATGSPEGVNHSPETRAMRQQRDPEFIETGSVYVMKLDGFREARHRFFGRTVMHEIPSSRLLEIDEEIDIGIAESRIAAR